MISQLFDKTVSAHAGATAIVYDDRRISFFELFIYVEWMARYFQSIAVQPGQRVAIFIPNSPELAISFLGLIRIGGAAVALDVTGKPHDLRAALELSQVRVVITTPPYKTLLDEVLSGRGHNGTLPSNLTVAVFEEDNIVTLDGTLRESRALAADSNRNGKASSQSRNHEEGCVKVRKTNGQAKENGEGQIFADHPALIQFIADNEDGDKLRVRTHADLVREAQTMVSEMQLTVADRLLCVTPLGHAGSWGSYLVAAAASGATLVMVETHNWDKILQVLAEEQATVFAGTSSLFTRLTEGYPDKMAEIPSLRLCYSSDEPLPPEISESLNQKFGINNRQLARNPGACIP
jgi:long-chain acyl-CoA synthetase